jgi:hypothetical protein
VTGNGEHSRPVVAVVSEAPLLAEALTASLAGVADVLALPAGESDLAGLLRSIRPAGVVVDAEEDAAAAVPYARSSAAPLLHVKLREPALAVWNGEAWEHAGSDLSPELVRNAVIARMRSGGWIR